MDSFCSWFDLTSPLAENKTVNIAQLREATREDHAAVEGSVSLMSDELTPQEYLATLERMYGYVSAWEQQAEVDAPEDLRPMVLARSRRRLLQADIEALHGTFSPVADQFPRSSSAAEFLGALYVMEGSRLGGQLIGRHVETVLGLHSGLGTQYFHGFGSRTGTMWKELIQVLEEQIPDTQAEAAIAAARRTFQSFGRWMRGEDLSADGGTGEVHHG